MKTEGIFTLCTLEELAQQVFGTYNQRPHIVDDQIGPVYRVYQLGTETPPDMPLSELADKATGFTLLRLKCASRDGFISWRTSPTSFFNHDTNRWGEFRARNSTDVFDGLCGALTADKEVISPQTYLLLQEVMSHTVTVAVEGYFVAEVFGNDAADASTQGNEAWRAADFGALMNIDGSVQTVEDENENQVWP